jgi:RNA polymerase sigma factor (sigma-70 family)
MYLSESAWPCYNQEIFYAAGHILLFCGIIIVRNIAGGFKVRTEDGDLISKYLSGDSDAFGLIIDKYRSGVYAIAYSRLGDFHDAQDVAQDVFIRAYQCLPHLKRYDSFASWLYRITVSLCKHRNRAKSRRPDREFIDGHALGMIETYSVESYKQEQTFGNLHDAIMAMPEIHRQALALHYLTGMTTQEMAKFIGISPDAVRKRLSRARARLKEELSGLETIEEQQLPATFTLRILEAVKHIRIRPLPRIIGLPWGMAVTSGVMFAFLTLVSFTGLVPDASPGLPDQDIPVSSKLVDIDIVYLGKIGKGFQSSMGQVKNNTTKTAKSPDISMPQIKWTKSGNAVLSKAQYPAVVFDGNEYRMYYEYDASFAIGMATSPDGVSWKPYAKNPVFKADKNEWDSITVTAPTVLYDGVNYRMWYSGYGDKLYGICLAISPDGINWDRSPDNPVLEGGPEHWDHKYILHPEVMFDGSQYRMWYTGYDGKHFRIGYAVSADGVAWDKHKGPVLELGENGEWDYHGVSSASVLYNSGMSLFEMWYTGSDRVLHRIGYATSNDGINWTKYPQNPVVSDSYRIENPHVMHDSEGYRMWYSDEDGGTYCATGLVISD